MSRIDVIIPCYNYGKFLRDCVDSVLSQEGCDVRILIIDDCSTDDSLELARAIAKGERRIELRAHTVNKGHIATYNEGIAWVTAPYMLLLSADDVLAPGAFARAIALLASNPKISFVHGVGLQFLSHLGTPSAAPSPTTTARIHSGQAYIEAQCARPRNPVETATAIVRTQCQKKAGGYDPALPHAGDMEMWLRLAAIGDVGFVETVQAFIRIHGFNMHHAYHQELRLGDFQQRIETFNRFFCAHAAQLHNAARLEALARRRLAADMLRTAERILSANPRSDVHPLFELARSRVPSQQFTLLMCGFHGRKLFRRFAGPRLWEAARRTSQILHAGAAR